MTSAVSQKVQAEPTPDWTNRGRMLAASMLVGILAVDLLRRQAGTPEGPPFEIATQRALFGWLVLIGCGYGFGKKLADLTQEHELQGKASRVLGYGLSSLGAAALMSFGAGATLLMADFAYHGLIKGKMDTRAHFLTGVATTPCILAIFLVFSGSRIDWLAVGIIVSTSTVWMWLNNRALNLGDNLFHQFRGDGIVVLGLLAVVVPERWLPVAVVLSAEHVSYAVTKIVAMRMSWYRDGAEAVPIDRDPLGLAFHATPGARSPR